MKGESSGKIKGHINILMYYEVKKRVRTGLTSSWSGIRHVYQWTSGLGD